MGRKDLSKHQRMKFLMFLGLTLCLDFALSNPLELQVEMEIQQTCLIKECRVCHITINCCPGFVCAQIGVEYPVCQNFHSNCSGLPWNKMPNVVPFSDIDFRFFSHT